MSATRFAPWAWFALSLCLVGAMWAAVLLPPPPKPCHCEFDPAKFIHAVEADYGWMEYRAGDRFVAVRVHVDSVFFVTRDVGIHVMLNKGASSK